MLLNAEVFFPNTSSERSRRSQKIFFPDTLSHNRTANDTYVLLRVPPAVTTSFAEKAWCCQTFAWIGCLLVLFELTQLVQPSDLSWMKAVWQWCIWFQMISTNSQCQFHMCYSWTQPQLNHWPRRQQMQWQRYWTIIAMTMTTDNDYLNHKSENTLGGSTPTPPNTTNNVQWPKQKRQESDSFQTQVDTAVR